jgi:hypothetical protein
VKKNRETTLELKRSYGGKKKKKKKCRDETAVTEAAETC